MRLVFIDDSEQRKPARQWLGDLIAVGAVIVPDDQVAVFSDRLAGIKDDLGVPASEEIKWKPPKGSHLARAGPDVLMPLRHRMLAAALECGVASAVVVVDHSRAYTSRGKAEVDREILSWLYERIGIYLGQVRDRGIVNADEPGGGARAERQWLADTLRLTENGTRYVKADEVVLPIVTAPSHHVPHLQLADLVTAAWAAAVAGRPHALELVGALKLLACSRPETGECGGAGLVLAPRPLRDLYWWLLHETHHRHRNGDTALGPYANTAKPDPRRPFLIDAGLRKSRQAS